MSDTGLQLMLHPTRLDHALARKQYPVVRDEWALNLIGVLNAHRDSNAWNDALAVLWWANGHSNVVVMACTTDPGNYWREHPMNPKGTAQVKPGYYPRLWRLGLHRGRYEALVQCGDCTVYRDHDRDTRLDGRVEDRGVFGINLHRAADRLDVPDSVDRWSAGCQVVPDSGDYGVLIALCKRQARDHGNQFNYALIEEQDLWKP